MDEQDGVYFKVSNGNDDSIETIRNIPHCNGYNSGQQAEIKQVIAMEEVTCKLKGIRVSWVPHRSIN